MKVLRIPTFWTAEQADTIHEFLGELQAAVWQECHDDIQRMHEEVRKNKTHVSDNDDFDDEVEF